MAAYANVAADLKRTGLGGMTWFAASTRASTSDDVLGTRIEAGWRQPLGRSLAVTPFAALEFDHLWQAPFNEAATGDPAAAALALHINRSERTSVPFTLGGRVAGTVSPWSGHALTLSAELGWQHAFNPQRLVTAEFMSAAATPFRVLGASASRDADARLSLSSRATLLASFTGRFSGVETAVGGFGGLQVAW